MYAQVIVDVLNSKVDRVFDYEIKTEGVLAGSRVLVPFAGRTLEGYVINIKDSTEFEGQVKSILQVLDKEPPITAEMLQLCFFMQKKYHVPLISALRQCLPQKMRGDRITKKLIKIAYLNPDKTEDMISGSLKKTAVSQFKIVNYLKENGECFVTDINKKFTGLNKLIEKEIVLVKDMLSHRMPYRELSSISNNLTLTDSQQAVIKKIEENNGKNILIYGITGSGKTEVYIECIKKALENNKTAIMLVPEIALTPQILKRFRGEFTQGVAILHSGLSDGERFDEWWRIRTGKAKVVLGARSAIFAPVENVGVIIIDEEHESSYNSETSPRYKTKDIADFRKKHNNATLVMGSATPDIESFYKTSTGEYILLEMPERINGKDLPPITIIDMRQEVKSGNNSIFSGYLYEKIEEALLKKEQVMLFINRRGFSPTVICCECGYVAKCRDCDASLVYHIDENQLKCHFCGLKYTMLDICPKCNSDKIRYGGQGTQRVVSELKRFFPEARVLRMDNDSTATKEGHYKITESFLKQRADILVGTQMIAKGHDFPNVSLVGVLDADMSLYFSDYRSSERTFSLITQVSGRAGRACTSGDVVLQTYTPFSYLYKLIQRYDYKEFFSQEIALRESAKYPPFASFVRILIMSEDENKAIEVLKKNFEDISKLKQHNIDSFIFFNKMKSPVKRINKKYRYQILMRISNLNFEKIIDSIYNICDNNFMENVVSYVEINPANLS